jgi:hypothetical protein
LHRFILYCLAALFLTPEAPFPRLLFFRQKEPRNIFGRVDEDENSSIL